MTKRTKTGQFKKGVSGNPTGRPKSSNLTQKDRDKFKDNPMDALLYLMNTARTKEEVYKYAKELMPYCKPKLSSIKSEIEHETTVTIKIEGFEEIAIEDKSKTIEGEAIDLTKDEIDLAAKDRIEQLEEKA